MTISIALKVGDGVVLGADSFSMLLAPDGQPAGFSFRTEKLFQLLPGLPVGLLVAGVGDLQGRSMASHVRELRTELVSPASPRYLNSGTYTIEGVCTRVEEFFRPRYLEIFGGTSQTRQMELLVAGFSAAASSAEVWSIGISQAQRKNVICRVAQTAPDGLYWQGAGAALRRLVSGVAPELQARFRGEGWGEEFVQSLTTSTPLWYSEMPLGDAVEVVKYLAQVVTGFEKFSPGLPLVAGPTDIAVISGSEGFRWIRKKESLGSARPPRFEPALRSEKEPR